MNVLAAVGYFFPPETPFVLLICFCFACIIDGFLQIGKAKGRVGTVVGVITFVLGVIGLLLTLSLFNSHSQNAGTIRGSGSSASISS